MRKYKRIRQLCIALVLVITVLCGGTAQAARAASTERAAMSASGEGMQDSEEQTFTTDGQLDGTPPEMDGEGFDGPGAPPDGEMPEGMVPPSMGGFPGGDGQDGNRPFGKMPDGEPGTPPDGEMPDGMMPFGNEEDGAGETGEGAVPPDGQENPAQGEDAPSGGGMPQNGGFSGKFNSDDGGFTGKFNFGGKENFSDRDNFTNKETQAESKNIDLETVLLLGASFLVLIGGLLFAKFYR